MNKQMRYSKLFSQKYTENQSITKRFISRSSINNSFNCKFIDDQKYQFEENLESSIIDLNFLFNILPVALKF